MRPRAWICPSDSAVIEAVEVVGYAVKYWVVEGRSCTLHIEKRPQYCDRGTYKVLLDARFPLSREIDVHDAWPRYYFDWDRMLGELEAWLQKRDQLPE